MNREEIISMIKSDLGASVVKVELTDDQYDQLIKKAKMWFQSRKGLIGCHHFTVVEGDQSINTISDSYKNLDVILPGTYKYADALGWCGLTDLIPASGHFGNLTPGYVTFDVTGYVQVMQTLQQRSQVLGLNKSWFEDCGKIYMHSTTNGQAMLVYKRKSWTIEELVGRDEWMFYRYCLAIAKSIIGMIRRKYSSYPAAGGPMSMDGAEMIAESKEEIIALDEEIFGSQGNAGGILIG